MIKRLHTTSGYMQMSETHRRMFDAGLPRVAMGHTLRDLAFRQISTGLGLQTTLVTAAEQRTRLLRLCEAAAPGGQVIAATLLLYSEGADEAAMACAGAIFETLFARYGGRCYGADELRGEPRDVEPAGVYLIHGISDQMHPHDAAAVRSYRYRRDGSLFLLVASALDAGIDDLMHKTLRIHDAHLFALDAALPQYTVMQEV